MGPINSTRRYTYLAAMLLLSLAGGVAAGLIVSAVRVLDEVGPEGEGNLKKIILYAGVSLIITLPLLLLTFSRWLRLRVNLLRAAQQAAAAEERPNAWSEAGKRITAPDPEELEEGDNPM